MIPTDLRADHVLELRVGLCSLAMLIMFATWNIPAARKHLKTIAAVNGVGVLVGLILVIPAHVNNVARHNAAALQSAYGWTVPASTAECLARLPEAAVGSRCVLRVQTGDRRQALVLQVGPGALLTFLDGQQVWTT